MKLLELTPEQILVDTLEYYSGHPERMCGSNSKCSYNPATIGKEEFTEGCAIGRLIDKNLAAKLDEENTAITSEITLEEIEAYSEPAYKKIKDNIDFFADLQDLHDKGYLTKPQLEDYPRSRVKHIIKTNKFNAELFTKWIGND
jgi:hypothetical protein